MTKKIYDLFISYAENDAEWVEKILLPSLGIPDERIMTRDKFTPGADKIVEFEYAITNSRYIILIITSSFLHDVWGGFGELISSYNRVVQQQKCVIPLILELCQLSYRLDSLIELDMTKEDNYEKEFSRLCKILGQEEADLPAIPKCPYPGMKPFTQEDSCFFYGREEEVEKLWLKIQQQNFFFVIGISGSGKSSLILAGLLPKIEKKQPNQWLVKYLRPGQTAIESPIDKLAKVLEAESLNINSNVEQYTQLVNILLKKKDTDSQILIIIDQFEEIFSPSTTKEQAKLFISAIKILRQVKRLKLILTMRADFYPDLMNSELWPLEEFERVEIAPLRGKKLREAIASPSANCGVYVEAKLVERLIMDAAEEPGALPLLQETMILLWGKMERRLLTLADYEKMGEEYGDNYSSGLSVAIANHADATFQQLGEIEKKISCSIFMRLIQFCHGRANTRRQQTKKELQSIQYSLQEFEYTLEHLITNRLLTASSNENNQDEATQIDIAHERLIESWPTLKRWINQYKEVELIHRRFIDKAQNWERLGRKKGGLLDPVELQEFKRWQSNVELLDLSYEKLLTDFFKASKFELNKTKLLKSIVAVSFILAWVAFAIQLLKTTESNNEIESRAIVDEVASNSNLNTVISSLNVAQKFNKSPYLKTNKVVDKIFDNLHQTLNYDSQNRHLFAEYNRMFQGNEFIYSLNFNPSGHSIVTTGNNQKVLIHNLKEKQKPSIVAKEDVIEGKNRNFKKAIFNQEGSIIVALLDDENYENYENGKKKKTVTVILLDLKTNKREELFNEYLTEGTIITNIIFSLDESKIFAVSENGILRQWDVKTRKLDQSFNMGYGLSDIIINPIDGTIAVGTYENKIKVFQINNKSSEILSLQDLVGHKESITAVNFSPDGNILASGSYDGVIKLWERKQDKWELKLTIPAHNGEVTGIRFSPDSQQIISVSRDKTFAVWDQEGRTLQSLVTNTSLSSVSVTPNQVNNQINNLIGGSIGKIAFPNYWNPQGMGIALWKPRHKIRQILSHEGFAVIKSIFIGNNKIASISENNQVKIWQKDTNGNWQEDQEFTENWQKFKERYCNNNDCAKGLQIKNFIFIPRLNLYVGNINNQIYLWNLQGEETLFPNPNPDIETGEHKDLIRSISVSSDGKKLVSGSSDKTVKLWDIEKNKLIRTFGSEKNDGHTKEVFNVKFSHNDKLIVSTGWDSQAILWDSETGKKIATLSHAIKNKEITVTSASFSSKDQTIATASDDGIVKIWDITGKLKKPFSTSLTTNKDSQLKWWNIPIWTKPPLDNKSPQKEGEIWDISFIKEDQQVAIAKQNRDLSSRNIRIFDLQGKLLQTLYVGEKSVNSLSFSDDGKSLAAAAGQDGVTVWRYWQVDDLLKYACEWSQDYFKFNADSDEKVKEAETFCQKLSGGE